jgi:hypothetical protein
MSATSLIRLPAAWFLVKQWAADTLPYVELEKALSNLGTFDDNEWRETFRKVELALDPSEEHPVSCVDIVIETARTHGITLPDNKPHNTKTTESFHPIPSSSQTGHHDQSRLHDLGQTRKRHKLAVNRFLDLDASEGDEPESDDEIQRDVSHLRQIGQSGLQTLSENLGDIASHYDADAGRQPRGLRRPSDAPASGGADTKCYFVDFYSGE